MYLIIRRLSNSFGTGYSIHADTEEGNVFQTINFYGYSKKEAIQKYRREHGLQRKHMERIEF